MKKTSQKGKLKSLNDKMDTAMLGVTAGLLEMESLIQEIMKRICAGNAIDIDLNRLNRMLENRGKLLQAREALARPLKLKKDGLYYNGGLR